MDGETSYESDLSESWSLIDINLNEESLSVAEGLTELENNSLAIFKDDKLKVDETKLEDFLRNCKEVSETDFSHVNDSESDVSLKNHGLPNNGGMEQDQGDSLDNNSENVEKQDSGDAESIEILDMDGSYSDSEVERLDVSSIEHLNFSTYQSDDEESSEGNRSGESRSNNSAVIKRRRRRSNKSSEESVNSVNSENSLRSPIKNRISSSDRKNERNNSIEKPTNCHPVYKHCRNNVANTILSLSVGVIFAGVACIAVGHFLGVQDAAQTAVELVETLKKLEVENAALQSHLLHLNRALRSRETNSKSENPLEEAQRKIFYKETPEESSTRRETNLKKAVLSDVRSTLDSIKLLSQLDDFIRKNKKSTDTEYGIDLNGFGKSIHDQLNSLRLRQESGAKILEGTDKKILKELQTIVSKLSSSQKYIENLNEKVVKLKDIVDRIERNIPDSSGRLKSRQKRKVPVTELDLQTMRNEIPEQTYQESIALFEFPKLETYYKTEMESEPTNSTRVFSKNEHAKKEKVKKMKKKHKKEKKKKEEKKHSKDNWKNRKFKDEKSKEKRDGTERKHIGNRIYKVLRTLKKGESHEKKKQKMPEFGYNLNEFNETIFQNKKHTKQYEDMKSKPKSKKMKKWKKVSLSNLAKESQLKKNEFSPALSGSDLFNVTGHWVFKWAGGREEIRRHQSLSDWQFERAKARKERRDDECTENWQFKRALAREHNRNDVRWPRGKYLKNAGKEFFHDGFSWM